MNKGRFFIGDALRFGWASIKENWLIFVLFFAIVIVLSVVQNVLNLILNIGLVSIGANDTSTAIIINLLAIPFMLVSILISMGVIKVTLKIHDGKKPEVGDFFNQYRKLFKYLVVEILYGLIVIGGFFFFIIPGIVWSLKYQYARNIIVDTDLGIIESLRESARITAGAKWDLFGFAWVTCAVLFMGFLALFVGLLVALPVMYLADIYVYRQLKPAMAGVHSASLHA